MTKGRNVPELENDYEIRKLSSRQHVEAQDPDQLFEHLSCTGQMVGVT